MILTIKISYWSLLERSYISHSWASQKGCNSPRNYASSSASYASTVILRHFFHFWWVDDNVYEIFARVVLVITCVGGSLSTWYSPTTRQGRHYSLRPRRSEQVKSRCKKFCLRNFKRWGSHVTCVKCHSWDQRNDPAYFLLWEMLNSGFTGEEHRGLHKFYR